MRRLGWAGACLLLVILVVPLGGYLWLRGSLPQLDGTRRVPELMAPVEIVRDRFAVPHIEAASARDAYFALGLVHAQDRLWQMEFQRRVGAGRLAEVVGAAGLPTDRFMRLLGLYRLAEASLTHLDAETIEILDAYAAGVNAHLATRSGPLPLEFLLLRHRPEPWTPADSLVIVRLMALDLARNWREELLRAQLAERLTPEQMADLWPPEPDDAPVTLAARAAAVEAGRGLPWAELAALLPAAPEGRGSNAWVVAGDRTATGAPLLANDPHLRYRAPGVWYLAHLRAPGLNVIGATFPGLPCVVLGRNDRIAWGFTNTESDTQDLFIERLDPADPGRYLTPDGSAPFEQREEVIRVRGGEPEHLIVRATRHGPVLSDLLPAVAARYGHDRVVALAWTGLREDERTVQAGLRLAVAEDWPGFVGALRDFTTVQQNILYADVTGRIGYYAPGSVPIRARGDGTVPVPGWSGEYDWEGLIPFEELPHAVDPPHGAFVNANNRPVGEDYPYLLSADWPPAYRARRIEELLDGDGHDLAGFRGMQGDLLSMLARDFLPLMLEAEPRSDEARRAMARLAEWDRVMAADRPEPLLFAAWYRELAPAIYADELGPLFEAYRNLRSRFLMRVLTEREVWCNDVTTPERETCPEVMGLALERALAELSDRYGADVERWRWGEAHPARMLHPVLGEQPLLGRFVNIELPVGGDATTLNVNHYWTGDAAGPFAAVFGPTYRGLYDLAAPDRSRFVAATGQSGNPLSRHYADLTALWAAGDDVPMSTRRADFTTGAIGLLRLEPDPLTAGPPASRGQRRSSPAPAPPRGVPSWTSFARDVFFL